MVESNFEHHKKKTIIGIFAVMTARHSEKWLTFCKTFYSILKYFYIQMKTKKIYYLKTFLYSIFL